MKAASAVAFSLLMVTIVPASLSAKGITVKITIESLQNGRADFSTMKCRFTLGDHPKPATHDHLKTGHR